MNITIRPFQEDADYERLEETEKLIYPDEWDSADYYRTEDKQAGDHPYQRWLAFDRERPVGNAEYIIGHWWDEPDQYAFYFGVIPEYWGRGVGKQLYQTLMGTFTERGAKSGVTWVREDHDRSTRFLEDRGFKMVQRDAQSELVIADFDETPFTGARERVAQHGVRIVPVSELQSTDPDWLTKLYDLGWLIRLDIPGTEKKKQETLDEWKARSFEHEYYLPEGYLVAVTEAGEYVGISNVNKDSSGEPRLKTGVTGIKREYRRKGVATAMKLAVIDFAKRNGIEKIITENEENNPMYDLNVALGFRPIPAWLTYKKRFD